MKKLKLSFVVSISSLLILGTSLAFASSDFGIADFFNKKKSKIETISKDSLVVTSDEFNITEKEYLDYKENIKLIHQLNKISFAIDDKDLLQQMIDNRLLLNYAKKQNIEVTDEEIMEYALQTKEAIEQNTLPEMNELFQELANSLGVSKEEYFTHPKTLKNYKDLLMVKRAIDQLYIDGVLDDDRYTLEEFKEDLRKEKIDKIRINFEKIKS